MQGDARLRKLRWLCRRGMKELDMLLESFLHENREPLARGDFPQLEALLSAEDDRLWAWLQKTSAPDNADFIRLLNEIRGGS